MQYTEEELKITETEKATDKIKGVTKFNYKDIRMLHKLGTGGFGTVRLAKIKISPCTKDSTKSGCLKVLDDLSTQDESDSSYDSPLNKKPE